MTRAKKKFDPTTVAQADLLELASMANKFHDEVQTAGRTMLESAWNAGQVLLTAKEQCEHGQWLPWLEANFRGSYDTASAYMRIATAYSNIERAQHFDPEMSIRGALEAIREEKQQAKPKDDKPQGKSVPKAKRPRTPTMPCQKFEKRYYGLQDDLSFIIDNADKDEEFAAAAYNQLDHLVEQRDQLTQLIRKLRSRFQGSE